MVAFGHSAVGATVGLLTYQFLQPTHPAVSIVAAGTAGVISHYITDIIPHGHFFVTPKNYWRNITLTILFDVGLSVGFFTWLAFERFSWSWPTLAVFFGIGGAQLPDIVDQLFNATKTKRIGLFKWEGKMHLETHWHGKNENGLLIGWYDIWQVATVSAAIYLISR